MIAAELDHRLESFEGLETELREVDRAYDACRAGGGDDAELRARRDELIAILARLDAEVG